MKIEGAENLRIGTQITQKPQITQIFLRVHKRCASVTNVCESNRLHIHRTDCTKRRLNLPIGRGLGIGGWGLETGDSLDRHYPIPNPQSPPHGLRQL